MTITIGSDVLLTIDGLTDTTSDEFVNNATATATLLSSTDSTLATVNLDYVSGSDGQYQGILPANTTSGLTAGFATLRFVATYSGNTYRKEVCCSIQRKTYDA